MPTMTFTRLASPLGELVLTASDSALTGVYFPPQDPAGWVEDGGHDLLARARRQLTEDFPRARTTFDLPPDPSGTPVQRRVWDALPTLPYGAPPNHTELARRLRDP